MARNQNIDRILQQWPYEPDNVNVRLARGDNGREVIQMRIDMGLLQMETTGRPDGSRPGGHDTYFDYLLGEEFRDADFRLTEEQCQEADREFAQFYHRRICWLVLRDFRKAVADADHTLDFMDFCAQHSPDEQWTMSHEQHRSFVLFHRIQAAALAELEGERPEAAVHEINVGLDRLRELFEQQGGEEPFEEDDLVVRLRELQESLRDHYHVGRTLQEQLADAVAAEQYELAARLRDELARRAGRSRN